MSFLYYSSIVIGLYYVWQGYLGRYKGKTFNIRNIYKSEDDRQIYGKIRGKFYLYYGANFIVFGLVKLIIVPEGPLFFWVMVILIIITLVSFDLDKKRHKINYIR